MTPDLGKWRREATVIEVTEAAYLLKLLGWEVVVYVKALDGHVTMLDVL